MALRHWFVVLFCVPVLVGGCLVASFRLNPSGQVMTIPGLGAGAALLALIYSLAMRGGVTRAAFAASACFTLTVLAVFGWIFGALFVWAYAFCEPGTHDMCLRR